jgi:RimJ/RimL family protein N-acetyltransferase
MAQTRILLPSDAPLLAEHLIRLSPDDRRLRFGGLLMPDDLIRRYVEGMDWPRAWQVGRFDAGALRGVVQLSVPRSDTDADAPWMKRGTAEFGISVEAPWRRQGIAWQLIHEAIAVARNRDVRDLYMVCCPENEPMRRLARKVGLRLTYASGEVMGHAELPPPDGETAEAERALEAAARNARGADAAWPQLVQQG